MPKKPPAKRKHQRRLTNAQVRKIRQEVAASKARTTGKLAYMDFAIQYKVSPHTIHCVVHNKTYRDVK